MFGHTMWHLFTFRGHPVYLTPSFLVVLVLFVGLGMEGAGMPAYGLLWAPVLFISILLHELGHAFATDRFGYGKSRIVFQGMGGVAISQGGYRQPKKAIAVSLAGPAVSGLLALASGAALFALTGSLTESAGILPQFLRLMFVANLFWTVFNLLPIYPMDGGQALYYAIGMAMKNGRKTVTTTATVSLVTLGLGVVFGWSSGMVSSFVLFFALYFAYINVQMLRTKRPVSMY